MFAIAARLALVVAAVAGFGTVLWQPWRAAPPAPESPAAVGAALTDADGAPIDDGGAFQPVPGFGGNEAGHMVRYEMEPATVTPALPAGVAELAWTDLWADGTVAIPREGERVGTPDRSQFPDGSTAEDVMNFFLDIDDMRSLQPLTGAVRGDLDGRRVRLAGYTTPVGFAEDETRFLLVPELGACIHVPPPPPNQIVYVARAATTPEMFAAVWVTGTLRARPVATILADVGYQLEDVTTEPYR